MSDVQLEIQKRHTLNWLIQGASQHAGKTFHYVVRDELGAISPKLIRCYDQFSLIGELQYWRAQSTLLLGSPTKFWQRAVSQSTHPFFGHALLTKYGGMLAQAARREAQGRCRAKGVTRLPFAFSVQTISLIQRMRSLEAPHRSRLIQLAGEAASKVWEVPREILDGELVDRVILPRDVIATRNMQGELLRACTIGYTRVVRSENEFRIVAKATNGQVLTKEFVKGAAELVCLHGLNQLDDEMYDEVLEATDRLEIEPWLLQSGGELWRRLLLALPDGQPVARVLMHLARLPPRHLESVIAAVIEQPERAVDRISSVVE